MIRKAKELKRIARGNLLGNYIPMMKAYLLTSLISLLVEMPFSMQRTQAPLSPQNIIYIVAVALIGVATMVLVCGQYKMHLSLVRTGKCTIADLFMPLTTHPDRYILTALILLGFTLVCLVPSLVAAVIVYKSAELPALLLALLLAIVSIVLYVYVTILFGMVYFILLDNPDMTAWEALKTAKQFIRSHKKDFLYLQCSFIGLLLLSLLTLGLAMFWVNPYMTQTQTLFYLDVKGELDGIITARRAAETTPEPKPTLDLYA